MDVGRVDDDAMARTDDAEAQADRRSHGSDVWMMEGGVYRRFSYFGKTWLRFFHPMRNPGVARQFLPLSLTTSLNPH